MSLLESLITGSSSEGKETFSQKTSPPSPPSPSEPDSREMRPVEIPPNLPAEPEPVSAAAVPSREAGASPDLPETVLLTRYPLAALCKLTLDSNPAASKLSADERRWVAEHLEAGVLCWLSYVLKPEAAGDASCPKGHPVTEGIFVKVLMGWACQDCQQVYPASECPLTTSGGKQ